MKLETRKTPPDGTGQVAEEGSRLYRRIMLLRWLLPLAIFLLVALYEAWEHILALPFHAPETDLANPSFFVAGTLIYGGVGPFVIWLVLSWIAGRVAEQQRAQEELERVHTSLQETHARLQESTSHLSALHEISRTIASAVDLQEVMDQVVRDIARITGASHACLRLLDEEQGHWTQVSSSIEEELSGEELLRILDSNLQLWQKGNRAPIRAEFHRSKAPKDDVPESLVGVPVARGDSLIGAIHACFPALRPPSESEVNLLATVSDEIATAIEAARLRTRHLQALYEVDQTVRAEFNLDRLLGQVLERMVQLCSADAGTIMLFDEARGDLVLSAAANVPREKLVERIKVNGEGGSWMSSQVVRNKLPLVVQDLDTETRWTSHLAIDGIRSLMSVPMAVGDRIVGVITLGQRRRKGFDNAHLGILSTISSQAALVVRNTQLYSRAEELAIAEERNRIAREIHDGIAQNLAFLGLKADLCLILMDHVSASGPDADRLRTELSAIKEGLRENIRGVRRSIFALRPLELERLGFVPALRKFAEGFGEQNGLSIQLNIVGDETTLPSQLEPPLFRAVQEALNNVGKHAGAGNVWIDLDLSCPDQVALAVRDDGRGFDTDLLSDAPLKGHRGVAQTEEKMTSLGGSFSIESAPGCGTKLEIKLPVKRQVYR